MRTFHEVFVLFEHELDLSKTCCILADELQDGIWYRHLRKTVENLDDIVGLQTDRYGGVERVGRQFVFVNVCWSTDGFSDGDEKCLVPVLLRD